MNAAQALAIAAAAYAIAMEEPLRAPLELAESGFEQAVERLEALGERAFEGQFRAIPDADCMERWAAM